MNKGRFHILLIAISFFWSQLSYATPTGGEVIAGGAAISQSGNTTQINQTSQNVVINWQGFDTAAHEAVNFLQPNSSAIALNRITSGLPTNFAGALKANGQVWIINPAGVLFTNTARIDVGGILATTAEIANSDFMNGNYHFVQAPGSFTSIINNGEIISKGLVALVAPHVENNGVISATLGKVLLASGMEYTLDFYGDQLIHFATDNKASQSSIKNTGSIYANGGQVILTANAAANVVENVIDMRGFIQADTASVGQDGSVILSGGENGIVNVSGAIKAKTIKILGDKVGLVEQAKIESQGGEILIGGNYQGKGPEQNASSTYIGEDVLISNGNGRVIVWSDDYTGFYGTINAANGFVETSSHDNLQAFGSVAAATWLLDPRNVTIAGVTAGGAFGGGNPDIFTPTANSATVNVATINAALNAGTSVTITTGATGTQAGNITVSSAISKTSGINNPTLTLTAAGTITVNNTISATTGSLNVVFNAGNAVAINNAINTNGGSFSSTSTNGVTLASAINSGAGAVVFNVNTDGAGAGNFRMNAGSSITSSNNVFITVNTALGGTGNTTLRTINTGGGDLVVNTFAGALTGAANAALNTSGGDVTLTSTTNTVSFANAAAANTAINTSGGALSISGNAFTSGNNQAFNTSGGNINITAQNAIALSTNSAINSGNGTVAINANQDGVGNQTFTMNAGSSITANNNIAINVNTTLGGAGTATLRTINSNGSDITINSFAGALTGALDAALNTSGGDVTLTSTTNTVSFANALAANTAINTGGGALNISGNAFTSGNNRLFNTGGGNVTINTQNASTLSTNSIINAGSGAVAINANQNAAGGEDFTMSAGSSINANAVGINVNTALGGTGTATLRHITTSGGAITVNTFAGNISSLADVALNSSGGNVTLTSTGSTVAFANAVATNTAINTSGGALHISSGNGFTLGNNQLINVGSGTVLFDVNTDGVGTQNFAMNAGSAIASTNNITINVSGTGNITQAISSGIVGNNLTANANSITLNSNTNNLSGVVSLNSASNATLVNAAGLILGASNIGNNLTLTAGGNIMQTGALNVQGTTTLAVTAPNSDILLSTQSNNFVGNVVFGGTLTNIRDISLRNINAAASLPILPSVRNLTLIFDNNEITGSGIVAETLTLGGLHGSNLFGSLSGFVDQTVLNFITLLPGSLGEFLFNNFLVKPITPVNPVNPGSSTAIPGNIAGILSDWWNVNNLMNNGGMNLNFDNNILNDSIATVISSRVNYLVCVSGRNEACVVI